MKRRAFIRALSSAAGWPLIARAQQTGKFWRIGLLETIPPELNGQNLSALRRGLRDLGYIQGGDYVLEYRSADGHSEEFPGLIAELVREHVDLIVTRGTPAARGAKTATSTTPIVMAAIGASAGYDREPRSSTGKHHGNITGMSAFTTGLAAKLRAKYGESCRAPNGSRQPVPRVKLGVSADLYDIQTRDGVVRAIEEASAKQSDALFVGNDSITQENRSLIAEFAAHNHWHWSMALGNLSTPGAFMSYSTDIRSYVTRAPGLLTKSFVVLRLASCQCSSRPSSSL